MMKLRFASMFLLACTAPAFAEMVEDFDGNSLVSAWWGSDSAAPYCYQQDFANTSHVHGGTYAMRVDFNKANDPGNAYSFFAASGFFNLRNFDYFSFWVYNDGSPLWIKIRFEDAAGHAWESDWAGIYPMTSTPSADWENLVVDLTRTFSDANVNWTAVKQILFMVEPGSTTTNGTFWLDDIELQRAPNSAPLDVLESDYYGWNSGGPFTVALVSNEFHNAGGAGDLGHHALMVNWGTKVSGDYSSFQFTPSHDSQAPAGRVGNYTNLSSAGNHVLELWVKSTTDNNMPILAKIDGNDIGAALTYTGGGTWQKLSWDYGSTAGRTTVTNLYFMPYPGAADNGGVMYVDDLNLTGGTPPALPLAPQGLRAGAVNSGSFTASWNAVSGAIRYEVQESANGNFAPATSYFTTNPFLPVSKNPLTDQGDFYYRVRSAILDGTTTNYGNFSRPITVEVPPDPIRQAETVEDFDGKSMVAAWWASDSSAPYCYQQDFASTNHAHGGSKAMKVVFNKANDAGSPYSFFSAMGCWNLRNFDYLSFWVYNDGSPLHIKIRFEDAQGNPWEADWANIFPKTEDAAANWENLVVDLTRTFGSTNLDWTSVRQIMFMVEPGSTTATGTFWLDDIELQRAPNSAPLDVFESDFYGWAAGAPFTLSLATNDFFNDGTPLGLGHHSLKISWPSKGQDYSNVTYDPKHDANAPAGRIGNYTNFALNGSSTIELHVKSSTETNMPILLKLDAVEAGIRTYSGSGDWQRLTWDFSFIAGKSSVTQLLVVPYPGQADTNGGDLYLDDLNLLGGSPAALPFAPTNLHAGEVAMGVFPLSWAPVPGALQYQVQESTDSDFSVVGASYFTTNASLIVSKDPVSSYGIYYYRVCSAILDGAATNSGSFSKPVPVQVPPEAVRQLETVENFDGGSMVAGWWGSDPASPYCYQQDFANTEHVHSGSNAMKVVFNKANDAGNAYSFFSAMGCWNLRNFDYFSFWVYNDGSPLHVKIRFEDASGNPWEADWAGIFPKTEDATANWENLVVDLSRTFSTTNVDWTAIRQIMFMIEPGSTNASGTFWLDDIELRRAPNSAPLDAFESDFYGWAAGGPFSLSLETNEFHNDGSVVGLGHHSLKVSWGTKAPNDYSNFTYTPKHDANAPQNRIGSYTNFTLYGNAAIEAWVKSATDTNIPILVKIDSSDVGLPQTYAASNAWQKLSWNFSSLPGATSITNLYFMPFPGAGDNGGVMYIDDVNVVGGMPPPVPFAPTNLQVGAISSGNYTLQWSGVYGAAWYEVQESRDSSFGTWSNIVVTGLSLAFSKDTVRAPGHYYYRIRSVILDGGTTNRGSFTKPIDVNVPPQADVRAETLADFDGQNLINTWWGSDPTPPFAYQLDFGNTQHVHSGSSALKVTFDKSSDPDNAYTFFAASGSFNLRNFDYLSFWIYHESGPLHLKVRFEESWDKAWETDWAGIFLQTESPTGGWENMVVDLSRTFSATNLDWTDIHQIIFMVEPGDTNAAGTFWMDDLQLRRAPNSAPLDVFESDFYGWGAGGAFSLSLATNAFHNDGTANGLGHHALQISWTSKGANYDNVTYIPEHDTAAPADRIGHYPNFGLNGYGTIELWVSSPTETNLPILVKLDNADVGIQSYTGTGDWQRLLFDYSGLQGKTNVSQVLIMPYPGSADANGGTLYLDDFNLIGGTAPVVPYAPTNLHQTADDPDEDGVYDVMWDAVNGVTGYDVQEDIDRNFSDPTTYSVTTNLLNIAKNPRLQSGVYYYRVRSVIVTGSLTNDGTFSTASAPARVIPGSIEQYDMVDDFDGNSLVSAWWAGDPSSPYAYSMDFASTQHVHSGQYALRVDYNKANDSGNPYTFFAASGYYNLHNYDYLSFWVYNDGSPLRIKIRFEQSADQAWEADWANIFPQKYSTVPGWENIVVDLTRTFSATNLDWTAIHQIMFMVEPDSITASGTFWLDDIKLWRAPNSAPLEPFESDFYGWAAGGPFSLVLSTTNFHNDGSSSNGLGQQSMQVSWGTKSNDYSSFDYITAHDPAAPPDRIGNYTNFSANGNRVLEAWVKSDTSTNIPILLKFDSVISDIGIQTYTGTGQWQKLSWDYSVFSGIDDVQHVYFMPYPGQSDGGGILYIDDINLVGGRPPVFATTPKNVQTTALDPDQDGLYTILWTPVTDAAVYEIQESKGDPNFGSFVSCYSTNAWLDVVKNPTNNGGVYYYRVRAGAVSDGVTNYSGFDAAPTEVRLASVNAGIINQSYDTPCAEVDNINIPLAYPGATAYRITAYQPKYFPTTIGERGSDFSNCAFSDPTIWKIGQLDGSAAEFMQSGFGGSSVYYAQDDPPAGIDQPASMFPKEINKDWMTNQEIRFTADEISDVNLEVMIGSTLNVYFTMVSGSLTLRAWAKSTNDWIDLGTRTFTSANLHDSWTTPDFVWALGTDTNVIRLQTVQEQSTPGAWAVYDYVELKQRDQQGETVYPSIYDDGNVVVDAVAIDFWWRAPHSMTLNVIGPNQTTNISGIQYFRITKRVPDTNSVDYSQVFVLYEDGNARILPHAPKGIDWTPFGASVILGPTDNGPRPFAGIDTVTLYTKELGMDITYDNGGSCHAALWVDREKNVVDVSSITYDTLVYPFARFRSMWTYDGKADIDRLETADGVFPVTKQWDKLGGAWWQFFKEVPTYHNTYCPDFLVEARGVGEAFLTQQAEAYNTVSNGVVVNRAHADGGQSVSMSVDGGELTFNVHVDQYRPDTVMIVRYADDDGGNNGDYSGNLIQVFVDGVLKDQTYSGNTGGWDSFHETPELALGDIAAGDHEIKIVTGPLTFGVDIDQFELISRPVSGMVRQDVLTRQAESSDSASGFAVTNLSSAFGGKALALTGAVARFNGPRGVAVDANGYIYVADTGNHTIRTSSWVGDFSTLAGLAGASGSVDGTGAVARFNTPRGIVSDRLWPQSLYAADTGNHTIRKISTDGAVTTLAGLAGSLGSADGTGNVARFSSPWGIGVDSTGTVYVADSGNHTIRKITPAGVVTTLAGRAGFSGSADGTGSVARFSSPAGLAVDTGGNIYVADTGNHTIREITPAGVVTTLAGLVGSSGSADGTGTVARFNGPTGIAMDQNWTKNVYVADTGNHTIREVTPNGVVTTVAGLAGNAGSSNGVGSAARFQFPDAIAANDVGNILFVAESQNHDVRRVTTPPNQFWVGLSAGTVTLFAGEVGIAGSSDANTAGSAVYNFTLAGPASNAYLSVRYADNSGPNKIETYLDGNLVGRFPSENTGGWNSFVDSPDIYLGDLTGGVHSLTLVANPGTYGVELDQFTIASYTSQLAGAAGRLQFASESFSVSEGQGQATITVARVGGSSGPVAVSYATGDGTAVAGQDYVTTTGTLNFTNGQVTGTFPVPVIMRSAQEGIRTVNLTLSDPAGGALLGQPFEAVLNISDAKSGSLQFDSSTYGVMENGGAATVRVTRVGGSDGPVTVDCATVDGSAKAGKDYVATAGTLNFASGETLKTFVVPVIDNTKYDGDRTLNLVLSGPTAGATLGRQSDAVLTIFDDEFVLPLVIGTNDGSAAEFEQSGYTNPFNAVTMRVGQFPKELNLTTWATQDIVIVADDFSVSSGLIMTLAVATNNGTGALQVQVSVNSGGGFQAVTNVGLSALTNTYVGIPPVQIALGSNTIRLVAQSGSGGTTWLWWDQLILVPKFYINHLGYTGGVDLFPQATAEKSNFTAAACCWMVGKYLKGASFTLTQQQIYDANTKDPTHNGEITPASCANWMISIGWPPYWYATRYLVGLSNAMKEAVYWMDYVPSGGTNAPAYALSGTNWTYKVVRGFATDKKPYNNGYGSAGTTFSIHGVWVNDPVQGGLGYNVYVMAADMGDVFLPSDSAGNYALMVEPPKDATEAARGETAIQNMTLEWAAAEPNPDMAAHLQSLLGQKTGSLGGPQKNGLTAPKDAALIKVIPYALLNDAGFMSAFNRATVNQSFTVNADNPSKSYVLTLGGVLGPASTVYVLKLDPQTGALLQATWKDQPAFYPSLSQEAAAWLGRPGGNPAATLVGADLVYDPAVDRSPFFPRWRLKYGVSGQTVTALVTQAQSAGLAGDSDGDGMSDFNELYAGSDPTNARSAFRANSQLQPGLGSDYVVIQWPSLSNRTYSVYLSTNVSSVFSIMDSHIPGVPPVNVYTTRLPAARAFYRIEVE